MVKYWLTKRVLVHPLLLRKNFAGQALALWLSVGLAVPGPRPTKPSAPVPSSSYAEIQQLLENGRRQSAEGHFEAACQLAQRAVSLADARHDTGLQAKTLLYLSACRIRLFDYRGAREAAEKCRQIATGANDTESVASAGVNLATIYMELGDYRLAGQEATRAADLFARNPKISKERQVKALLIYADTEAERTRNQIEAERNAGELTAQTHDIERLER